MEIQTWRTVRADLGADLQELQANRLTLSASQGGLLQSETTQGSNCCSFMRFSMSPRAQ